jgi:chromate reductase, NAD(P)H dehydrogenase (quinone)
MTLQILAVPGSLRTDSFNRRLLSAARTLLPPDLELVVYDELADVPPFDEDHENEPMPPGLSRWREAIRSADALLIATPEYNGSIPGQLKNALDWASRPAGSGVLTGKPVATCSASPSGYGAAWAQAELRKVCERSGASVIGDEVVVASAHEHLGADGTLTDPDVVHRLSTLLTALGHHVDPGAAA